LETTVFSYLVELNLGAYWPMKIDDPLQGFQSFFVACHLRSVIKFGVPPTALISNLVATSKNKLEKLKRRI